MGKLTKSAGDRIIISPTVCNPIFGVHAFAIQSPKKKEDIVGHMINKTDKESCLTCK